MTARAVDRSAACAAGAVLVASAVAAAPAYAHRLDEYLQAATIAVSRDRAVVQLRLTPGVAVFPRVFAAIDADGDGVASPAEQRGYAERVVRDLALAVDGERRPLRLVAAAFPDVAALRAGRGEVVLDLEAAVPPGAGARRLTFENRHQHAIGVYLVNALVPRDSAVRITTQKRNPDQTWYALDYALAGERVAPWSRLAASGAWPWVGMAVLAPLGWLVLLRQRRTERACVDGAADERAMSPRA